MECLAFAPMQNDNTQKRRGIDVLGDIHSSESKLKSAFPPLQKLDFSPLIALKGSYWSRIARFL
jgi:hypothetical protein